MKVSNLLFGIIVMVKFSAEFLLDSDDFDPLLGTVSEIACQLLSDATYRTVHFRQSINDSSFNRLISNIAQKYVGPVEMNTENYFKDDAVITFIISNSLDFESLNSLKKISFLLMIVNMVNQIDVLPTVMVNLRTTNIVKVGIVTFDSKKKAEEAFINISVFSRYKTKNCESSHTFISTYFPPDESRPIAIKTSIERSVVDFQGCSIDAGIGVLAPFTVITENGNTSTFSGVEIAMVRALAERFNFKVRFLLPPHGMQWGVLQEHNSTGLMGMIQNGEVDFGLGSIARSLIRNTLLIGGVGNFYDQLIFALPPGIPYTPMEKLIMPVTTSGWIFIIVGCIVAAILFSFVIDERMCRVNFIIQNISLADVWFILLGGAMYKPPDEALRRYVLIGWLMMTLVFRSAYQAILFDHLRGGVEFKPILTLEDMFEAKLKFHMFNVSVRHFGDHPEIMKRAVLMSNNAPVQKVLGDIADNKLLAGFPLPRSNIAFFNKQRLYKSKVHTSRYVIESYEVATHYPRHSPLPKLFDDMVLRILAVGLNDYWARQFRGTVVDNSIELKQLNVQNLIVAFILHGMFCSLSCVIFLAEIVAEKAVRSFRMYVVEK